VLSFFKNKGSTAKDILENNNLDYTYGEIILSACDDMSTLFSMRSVPLLTHYRDFPSDYLFLSGMQIFS
jgi:hypothetical protein